jgi:hypothetical protein
MNVNRGESAGQRRYCQVSGSPQVLLASADSTILNNTCIESSEQLTSHPLISGTKLFCLRVLTPLA